MLFPFLGIVSCDNEMKECTISSESSINGSGLPVISSAESKEGDEGDASFQLEANRLNEKLLSVIAKDDRKHRFIKTYPNYYGGSIITNTGKLLLLVSGSFEDGKKTLLSHIGRSDIVEFHECRYSFQELTDIMNTLNDSFSDLDQSIKKNLRAWYIKDDDNCVVVSLRDTSEYHINTFKEFVMNHPAIQFELFVDSSDNREIESVVCSFSSLRDPSKIGMSLKGGGVVYEYKNNDRLYGSWAFRVREVNSHNTIGMITAGHVVHNDSVFWGPFLLGEYSMAYETEECDAAFVKTKPLFTPSNILENNWKDSISTDTTQYSLSTQTSLPGVGTVINKRGWTSGRTTGTVLSTNYTNVNSGVVNGPIVTNMTLASFYSDYGDSGGIVYTYISSTNTRYTVGVLRGRLGDDHYKTVFTKAGIVLSIFGVERY